MATTTLTNALEELDPADRALLDLSVRRGVDDGEIAGLLGIEPQDVAARRSQLLARLAGSLALGADGDVRDVEQRLRSLPDGRWPGPDRRPSPEGRPTPWRAALAGVALLVAVAIVVVAIATSGDDEESRGEPATAQGGPAEQTGGDEGAAGESPGAGTAVLEPLPGLEAPTGGRVRLRDSGDEAVLDVQIPALEEGTRYEVWLYESVIDSVAIGEIAPDGTLRAPLPADPAHYTFVDVSRESDGTPSHSGESVLRAPVSDLLSQP